MKRIKNTAGAPAPDLLRDDGAGPDPAFRAGLRERLLAEARAARRGDRLDRSDGDPRNSAR